MRIVCISDTHCKHRALDPLPDGDVLIHAGDVSYTGKAHEIMPVIEWLGRQSHAVKILVPGNHDFDFEKNPSLYKNVCREHGIRLLIDEPYKQGGLKFYGTPWVPNLQSWAFYGDRITLVSRFSRIPNDTAVLITHGPPAHVLDEAYFSSTVHYGSVELSQRLSELHELKLHVFGHIHESHGQHTDRYISVNACSCDIDYDCVNKPIVVEI